jgi:hypothetical protein
MVEHTSVRLSDWQRRKYPRFNLEYPVRITIDGGGPGGELETVSKNLSIGGFMARSATAIPLHTPITFIISVHGEQAMRPIHLVGEGKIVRVESYDNDAPFFIAVQCKMPIAQWGSISRHNRKTK